MNLLLSHLGHGIKKINCHSHDSQCYEAEVYPYKQGSERALWYTDLLGNGQQDRPLEKAFQNIH